MTISSSHAESKWTTKWCPSLLPRGILYVFVHWKEKRRDDLLAGPESCLLPSPQLLRNHGNKYTPPRWCFPDSPLLPNCAPAWDPTGRWHKEVKRKVKRKTMSASEMPHIWMTEWGSCGICQALGQATMLRGTIFHADTFIRTPRLPHPTYWATWKVSFWFIIPLCWQDLFVSQLPEDFICKNLLRSNYVACHQLDKSLRAWKWSKNSAVWL